MKNSSTKGFEVFGMSKIVNAIKHIALTLMAFVVSFPYIWMFISSFKADNEVFDKSTFFPKEWLFENYVNAMKRAPFDLFFLNTVLTSAIIVAAQLVTCSLAAYAFAKMDFRGKKTLFMVFMASMMIPGEATIISNFITVHQMGLINTYFGLVITSLTSVFGIFLLRQFFKTVPDALLDSARIDGCSDFRIFISILLPLAKSALATVAIFAFINSWNNYMWPLIVTNSNEMRTVQIGLRYMVDPDLGPDWPEIMAASTVIIIPVMAVFVFLQKYFVQGITKTGIK